MRLCCRPERILRHGGDRLDGWHRPGCGRRRWLVAAAVAGWQGFEQAFGRSGPPPGLLPLLLLLAGAIPGVRAAGAAPQLPPAVRGGRSGERSSIALICCAVRSDPFGGRAAPWRAAVAASPSSTGARGCVAAAVRAEHRPRTGGHGRCNGVARPATHWAAPNAADGALRSCRGDECPRRGGDWRIDGLARSAKDGDAPGRIAGTRSTGGSPRRGRRGARCGTTGCCARRALAQLYAAASDDAFAVPRSAARSGYAATARAAASSAPRAAERQRRRTAIAARQLRLIGDRAMLHAIGEARRSPACRRSGNPARRGGPAAICRSCR